MLQAEQIALIDGKPVYRDCEGNLCIETSNFRHLRDLMPDEKGKLRKVLERVKAATSLVEMGG